MTFYAAQVGKIQQIIDTATGGRDALMGQGLELMTLQVRTTPDPNGLVGTINLEWDSETNQWAVSVG